MAAEYSVTWRILIPEFTGISAPYEILEAPDLSIDTDHYTVEESINLLSDYVRKRFGL